MRRRVRGLSEANLQRLIVPDGIYEVRVDAARLCPHPTKPVLELRLQVLAPRIVEGCCVTGCLRVTERELWKLRWFLRDFGYDADLLARDELDEKQMIGLRGTARLMHTVSSGRYRAELVGFAPASVSTQQCEDRRSNKP